MAWFPGDDLFTPLQSRGLPIGNHTSQLWSSCYLDPFDHFVKRELRRERPYDAVILDPPSYGHGASGQVWRLSKHLAPLLGRSLRLTANSPARFVLLTCHTPGYDENRLAEILIEEIDRDEPGRSEQTTIDRRAMSITAASGRIFPAGDAVFMTEGVDA